jgi:hypothetical protein
VVLPPAPVVLPPAPVVLPPAPVVLPPAPVVLPPAPLPVVPPLPLPWSGPCCEQAATAKEATQINIARFISDLLRKARTASERRI